MRRSGVIWRSPVRQKFIHRLEAAPADRQFENARLLVPCYYHSFFFLAENDSVVSLMGICQNRCMKEIVVFRGNYGVWKEVPVFVEGNSGVFGAFVKHQNFERPEVSLGCSCNLNISKSFFIF